MLEDTEEVHIAELFVVAILAFAVRYIGSAIIVVVIKKVLYLRRILRLSGGSSQIISRKLFDSPSSPTSSTIVIDASFEDLVGAAYEKMRNALGTAKNFTMGLRGGQKRPRIEQVDPRTDTPFMGTRKSGSSVLAAKNSMTRLLKTHCIYTMFTIPIRYAHSVDGARFNYLLDDGCGPGFFWTFAGTATTSTTDVVTTYNPPFTFYNNWDGGMESSSITSSSNRGLGKTGTVYVFAADYPFLVMNPDTNTQTATAVNKKNGQYMYWAYKDYSSSTDLNQPITLNTVILNKDWTYMTHYFTDYSFDFQNNSASTYVVEILVFRFKADVDAMNYNRQALAPCSRQASNMQAYCEQLPMMANPEDISIIQRKRFKILGFDSYGTVHSEGSWIASRPRNEVTINMRIKNKWVIKRPILTGYDVIGDITFFNTYYDKQRGVYIRMQAWPTSPFTRLVSTNNSGFPVFDFASSVALTADTAINNTTPATPVIGFSGVSCIMQKKSYFKLDEQMSRGPFAPS